MRYENLRVEAEQIFFKQLCNVLTKGTGQPGETTFIELWPRHG